MSEAIWIIAVCAIIFIGLPWLFLHYNLQMKRQRGLSIEDERLLDDMHETARRLDERLVSIERILTAENPRWRELAAAHSEPAPLPYDRRH